jgi:hypothetical protein
MTKTGLIKNAPLYLNIACDVLLITHDRRTQQHIKTFIISVMSYITTCIFQLCRPVARVVIWWLQELYANINHSNN